MSRDTKRRKKFDKLLGELEEVHEQLHRAKLAGDLDSFKELEHHYRKLRLSISNLSSKFFSGDKPFRLP